VTVRGTDHVGVDGQILLEKANFVAHIGEQTSYLRRKVDHMGWLDPLKESINCASVAQIPVASSREVKLHPSCGNFKKAQQTRPILLLPQQLFGVLKAFSLCRLLINSCDKLLDTVADHAARTSDEDHTTN